MEDSCCGTFGERIISAMTNPREPVLNLLDQGATRRTVAICFLILLLFLIPGFSRIPESVPWMGHALKLAIEVLGALLAYMELRHSGEANKHREKLNSLTEEVSESHKEANRLRQEALTLQIKANGLQEEIERRWSKIRLYARVHPDGGTLKLFVSNLSEFDLWINNVQLVVSETGDCRIGGTNRISKGQTEEDYQLWGNLISMNGNRVDSLDMKFHVKIIVVGVEDAPVFIGSPRYHLKAVNGKITDFEVVPWDV